MEAGRRKGGFTNGVFDLLHIGHITYMAKAASLGTRFIIGLNADASVKRLKGRAGRSTIRLTGPLYWPRCFLLTA
ncbi:adenylyltransferase/cytidyltransferase family protein [Mucilaginibacter antarcticus]|uniref:adenylyltransferase/cytidyltransferase family protein n=1 Tax=Mucilaginibacter antarcticus TaxID=1855725 RepID=UPI0036443DBD